MNNEQRNTGTETMTRSPRPWWPLALIAAGLILLGGMAWVALGWWPSGPRVPVAVTGSPRLQTDQQRVDLGERHYGQVVEVSFQLANIGDQTLTFTETPVVTVAEGCCPPKPALGRTVLRPGETTVLTLEFAMHEGMGGQHDFRVHLATNDPQNSATELQVLSNWVP
jgi:hypothetical protein